MQCCFDFRPSVDRCGRGEITGCDSAARPNLTLSSASLLPPYPDLGEAWETQTNRMMGDAGPQTLQ